MQKERRYQFAAMMGFERIFFLDGCLWRSLGIEDLFFFFWRSRPMLKEAKVQYVVCLDAVFSDVCWSQRKQCRS